MNRWRWLALALTGLFTLVVELTMHHDAAHHHWWNQMPAFWMFFGFLGCLVLIFFAKALGTWFLNRKEDYFHDR